MITATGRNDENGAVAFSLAHEARPVEMAGEVSRIFMGVQIQCAQCHDHKTDSWKRRQFHEFAAFFAGVRPKQVVAGGMGQPPVIAVVAQGPRRYTMPDKDNPAKQIPIAPRFFLASSKSNPEPVLPEGLAVQSGGRWPPRTSPARTTRGLPRRTSTESGMRSWARRSSSRSTTSVRSGRAKGPEVLDPLAAQWQKGGYDIRWMFRTILNTEAYQRRVRSTANAAGKTPFASSCPSRLRADQVFDALVQALALPLDSSGNLVPNPNANKRGRRAGQQSRASPGASEPGRSQAAEEPSSNQGRGPKKAAAGRRAGLPGRQEGGRRRATPGGPRLLFDRLFGVDPSAPNEDVMGTIPQALS